MIEAGITPSEIDLMNCHASSTIVGDISEARGVRSMLKNKHIHNNFEALQNIDPLSLKETDIDESLSNDVLISALKGNLGHS